MKESLGVSVMAFRLQAIFVLRGVGGGVSHLLECSSSKPLEVLLNSGKAPTPHIHAATLSQEACNNFFFFFERQRLAPIPAKQCIYYC